MRLYENLLDTLSLFRVKTTYTKEIKRKKKKINHTDMKHAKKRIQTSKPHTHNIPYPSTGIKIYLLIDKYSFFSN